MSQVFIPSPGSSRATKWRGLLFLLIASTYLVIWFFGVCFIVHVFLYIANIVVKLVLKLFLCSCNTNQLKLLMPRIEQTTVTFTLKRYTL